MNNHSEQHHRRNYFIAKKFQATFILKFCSLVILGGLLTIGLVYFFASQATTVSIVNSRVMVRSTADFILPLLIQTVAVVIILVGLATILVALLFSHKIAGPLYRFKKVLEQLEGGNFSSTFSIRNFDQLQVLADSLNQVVVKNREQLALLKKVLGTLENKLDKLTASASDEQKIHISELKSVVLDAKNKLDYFKTT